MPLLETLYIPLSGSLPALGETQQEELKAAVQELPAMAGIELANWNWKVVHQFVSERFGISLSRSGCLNYLHRLGFVLKRPKRRLVKADERKRECFVVEYAALTQEARLTGGKIFFADEAHFRADAELRSKWVLKGEPALVVHFCSAPLVCFVDALDNASQRPRGCRQSESVIIS